MTDIIDEIAGPEEAIPADDQVETPETPEAAPEPVEQPKPEPEADHRRVPLQALHEARARQRELQQEAEVLKTRMSKMEALWEQLNKQNAKEDIPPYEDDPAGHLNAKIATLQKQLEGISQKETQREEQMKAASAERQMLEQYAGSVRAFSQKSPDFNDAYQFLAKVIDDDLQARGITDPVERTRIMQYEEGVMVGRVMHQGGDPAELIYNYAKKRGYKGKEEDDKLTRIEEGQKAAMSLSTANGKGEGAVTLERLAELSETDPEAFDREWENARRKGILG